MTFSAEVKYELCKVQPAPCCAAAELHGALLFAHTFTCGGIRAVTSHPGVAERLKRLLRSSAGLEFDDGLLLKSPDKLEALFGLFGLERKLGQSVHINHALAENVCCRAALCRGVFLTGGSVTDPEKKYHLEILTTHRHLARELLPICHEDGFEPHCSERGPVTVLAFQSSEGIEDFLTYTGAPVSALKLMDTKLMKEVRNQINRAVNCETGNLERTVAAAARQIPRLEALRRTEAWSGLPEPLRKTAEARIENPDASLAELAGILGISKSALNHRLRKLLT